MVEYVMGCLNRLYFLVKRHIDEIALDQNVVRANNVLALKDKQKEKGKS